MGTDHQLAFPYMALSHTWLGIARYAVVTLAFFEEVPAEHKDRAHSNNVQPPHLGQQRLAEQ